MSADTPKPGDIVTVEMARTLPVGAVTSAEAAAPAFVPAKVGDRWGDLTEAQIMALPEGTQVESHHGRKTLKGEKWRYDSGGIAGDRDIPNDLVPDNVITYIPAPAAARDPRIGKTEQCAYCRHVYPAPIGHHHDAVECAENLSAEPVAHVLAGPGIVDCARPADPRPLDEVIAEVRARHQAALDLAALDGIPSGYLGAGVSFGNLVQWAGRFGEVLEGFRADVERKVAETRQAERARLEAIVRGDPEAVAEAVKRAGVRA